MPHRHSTMPLRLACAALAISLTPLAAASQGPAADHSGCLPAQERPIPPLAGVRLDARQRSHVLAVDAKYAPQRDSIARALRVARAAAARARAAQDFAHIEPTLHAIDSLRTREKAVASAWRLDVRPILDESQRRRMDLNVQRAKGFERVPPKGQRWAPCSADDGAKASGR